MSAPNRKSHILFLASLAVLAVFAFSASSASAANFCVGSHPGCSGPLTYPGTTAGLSVALSDANTNGAFPGADTVWVGDGEYEVLTTLPLTLTAPLTVIGESRTATVIKAGANNVIPLQLSGNGTNTADISNLRIEHEGYSTGYGVSIGAGKIHDIDVSVVSTTGSVRGVNVNSTGALEDSTITATGNGAIAAYVTGSGRVEGVQITGTDGLSGGIQTGGSTIRTFAELSIRNIRRAIFSDQGPIVVRDVFVNLGAITNGSAVESENHNNCATCAVELDAKNLTVVGTGTNQVGVAVGGTATNDAAETGTGVVYNSYFDLTGTNAKALRCTQSGDNTTASLSSDFVAAQPARITRTGTCSGADANLLDTTSLLFLYNLVSAGDYRPVTGSPLIDAGNPGEVIDPDRADADGLDRIYDGDGDLGDRIDIGAYEYQPAMAPGISFTATPTPVDAGQNVSFSASTSDPDGGAVTVAWDFGDSATASGSSTTHAYSSSGDFTVTATATDNEGESTSVTRAVHVNSTPPTTPTPLSDLPNAVRGQSISFTASGSTDPDGDSFTYEWSFTGGGTDSGTPVVRAATSIGVFTATVRAVDSHGEESPAASVSVTIHNQPPNVPTVTPSAATGFRGDTFTFTPNATDPDGDTLAHKWNFGDGATTDFVPAGPQTHAYTTVGVKTITLAVNDAYSGTNSGTATIEVLDRAPVLSAVTRTGGSKIGDVQSFGVSATDADGDPVTFTWNFGDGGTAKGASVVHAYARGGTYSVTASANDGQGAVAVATTSVTIDPPTLALGKPSKKFKLGKKGFQLGGATSKPNIVITSSSANTVTLKLARSQAGWVKGSKCSKKKPSGAKKRCDIKLAGSQSLQLPAGDSRLSFGGVWAKKKLAPGKYRLTATPSGGSPAASVVLTLVK